MLSRCCAPSGSGLWRFGIPGAVAASGMDLGVMTAESGRRIRRASPRCQLYLLIKVIPFNLNPIGPSLFHVHLRIAEDLRVVEADVGPLKRAPELFGET